MSDSNHIAGGVTGHSSGLLALWVGAKTSAAYHSLGKDGRARVRKGVKALLRELVMTENPSLPPLEDDVEGGRNLARGLVKVLVEEMRKTGKFMSVVELTHAVNLRVPGTSAFVLRRLLNKCSMAPNPIMLREKVKNPNQVFQGRRDYVVAFRLTPDIQRQRKTGSQVRDGQIVNTTLEDVVAILGKSAEPMTAREILKALPSEHVTIDNLYTYLTVLKGRELIAPSGKKKESGRSVNVYRACVSPSPLGGGKSASPDPIGGR